MPSSGLPPEDFLYRCPICSWDIDGYNQVHDGLRNFTWLLPCGHQLSKQWQLGWEWELGWEISHPKKSSSIKYRFFVRRVHTDWVDNPAEGVDFID